MKTLFNSDSLTGRNAENGIVEFGLADGSKIFNCNFFFNNYIKHFIAFTQQFPRYSSFENICEK